VLGGLEVTVEVNEKIFNRMLDYMRATAEKWNRLLNLVDNEIDERGELSEAYILRAMEGHALFDDPAVLDDPGDMTLRDLVMFGTGYLRAESIQYANCAGVLQMMIAGLEAARLTPVGPDRACAPGSDDENSTRAAGEHDG